VEAVRYPSPRVRFAHVGPLPQGERGLWAGVEWRGDGDGGRAMVLGLLVAARPDRAGRPVRPHGGGGFVFEIGW